MELYKVLLVDDEPMILKGMEEGIPWEKYGFEVAGTASNGKEAWEIIQNNRPDVLISDIRMPFMNGLELVKLLKENYIKMKVILVSGYDEFEYAQEAIRYGVSEYLLKPLSMPQVEELLNNIHKEITHEIEEKKNKTFFQNMLMENLPILRERFYIEVMEGKIKEDNIERRLSNLKIDFKFNNCVVALLQLKRTKIESEIDFFSVSNTIQDVFENFAPYILFKYLENIVLIANIEDKNHMQDFLKCLNEANMISKRFADIPFYCGVGNFANDIMEISMSYKNAVAALEYSVVSDDEPVIFIQDIDNIMNNHNPLLCEQYLNNLIGAIKLSDKRTIRHEIDCIFLEMDRGNFNIEEYQSKIIELCIDILKVARQYSLSDKRFSSARILITDIFSIRTGEQLKEWMIEYTIELSDAVNRKRLDINELLAQKAKDYIDENFRDSNLSVETLCDYLHISPSHFSNIFKKIHGINFINYLTNKRIYDAVYLLKTTDLKTKVISEMVGYPESNYFSYVFKKTTNISPANFRKKEREKNQ